MQAALGIRIIRASQLKTQVLLVLRIIAKIWFVIRYLLISYCIQFHQEDPYLPHRMNNEAQIPPCSVLYPYLYSLTNSVRVAKQEEPSSYYHDKTQYVLPGFTVKIIHFSCFSLKQHILFYRNEYKLHHIRLKLHNNVSNFCRTYSVCCKILSIARNRVIPPSTSASYTISACPIPHWFSQF